MRRRRKQKSNFTKAKTVKQPCGHTNLVSRQVEPLFCPVVAYGYGFGCDHCVSRGMYHKLMHKHYNR
jgi:hypothetical protein